MVTSQPGTISTTAFLKPYDYLIWVMLLLVTLHSVSIAMFLFEWAQDKFKEDSLDSKKSRQYAFEYINEANPTVKVNLKP